MKMQVFTVKQNKGKVKRHVFFFFISDTHGHHCQHERIATLLMEQDHGN